MKNKISFLKKNYLQIILFQFLVLLILFVLIISQNFFVDVSQNNLLNYSLIQSEQLTGSDNFFIVSNSLSESVLIKGYDYCGREVDLSENEIIVDSGEKKIVYLSSSNDCESREAIFTYNLINSEEDEQEITLEKDERISRLNFASSTLVCVDSGYVSACGEGGGSTTDTNWQTNWEVFDANMQATYALIGSSTTSVFSDSNILLVDLNGGGKNLFNFLDANFSGNVIIDGNLSIGGKTRKSSCPTGYVLVPGNPDFGTTDFCAMKYEAQQGDGKQAVSVLGGTPWESISWYDAHEACQRAGAHLTTNAEWMTIARNIEAQASNWQSGVVGSGCLYGGHTDDSPTSLLATSSDGDPYYGTNDSASDAVVCPFVASGAGGKSSRRTMYLSNGEIIWDISGNNLEFVDEQCTTGSGYSATHWYSGTAWVEWNNGNLTDYESYVAGPSGSYTSANGAGEYYTCKGNGYVFERGGGCSYGPNSGIFTLSLYSPPYLSYTFRGFRCVLD